MVEAIVLLKKMPESDWLHRRQEAGLLRSSMNFTSGPYASAGILPLDAAPPSTAGFCPKTPGGCDVGELLPILNAVSHIFPGDFIVFVLLEIEQGRRREWADAVRGVEEMAAETQLAAAHIIGSGQHNAIVEIVASDHEAMLEAVLAVSDLPGVRAADVHRVHGPDTRGMGVAAQLTRTTRARAAKKSAGRAVKKA